MDMLEVTEEFPCLCTDVFVVKICEVVSLFDSTLSQYCKHHGKPEYTDCVSFIVL